MEYVFILNPKAGKGKCKNLLPKIENACKNRNFKYEIRYITDEKDGSIIASEYKDKDAVIYAVGGDGTITKTLKGVVENNLKLGIIPAGSGNDTYRSVRNLPKGTNKIDIAKINEYYFINIACLGIDAEVANNIDIMKAMKISPKHIYNVSVLYTFTHFKFKKAKIKIDAKEIENYYTILSVCNGGYYGGGYNIAPKSELNDGLLDVYYAEKMSRIKMIPLFVKLIKGKHEGKRRIHKYRTKHVQIELDEEVTFNVDGEKVKDKTFKIDVLNNKLNYYNDEEFVKEILK